MGKINIYLFANKKYGLPFIKEFLRCSRQYDKNANFYIVLSFKKSSPNKYNVLPPLIFIKNYFSIQKERKILNQDLSNSEQIHINILIAEDINSKTFINKIKLDSFGICAGFNQIFKQDILHKFVSLVNFHPSILPYYRGPVPSYWCLKNGEVTTGFTLHILTEKIDAGRILYQENIDILNNDNFESLDQRIANRAKDILRKYLVHIISGNKWIDKQVDPSIIYKNHISYKSFPKRLEDF